MGTLICLLASLIVTVSGISIPDCIDNHFKKVTFKSNDEKLNCHEIVQNFTVEFKNNVMARLTAEDDQSCILKTLDEFKIIDFFLKGFGEDSRTNFTQDEYYKDMDDVNRRNYIEASEFLCWNAEKWTTIFEKGPLNSGKSESFRNPSKHLCKQKYFIDKKFINPVDFGINVASLNATNCGPVIKEIERETKVSEEHEEDFDSVFIKSMKCYQKKLRDAKVFLILDSVETFSGLELTEGQTNKLRAKFVDNQRNMARFVLECARDQV
jgi:hypothetical protein